MTHRLNRLRRMLALACALVLGAGAASPAARAQSRGGYARGGGGYERGYPRYGPSRGAPPSPYGRGPAYGRAPYPGGPYGGSPRGPYAPEAVPRGFEPRAYPGEGSGRFGAPPAGLRRGQVMPPAYAAGILADPRIYRLRRPPNGYGWVVVGPTAYLLQRSTGLILDTAPLY